MADNKVFLSRFTPSRTAPEVLERIFVQRGALLKDAEERIRESAVSGNKHHLLLVGPRGSGKTHFVSLIFHQLSARDDLRERLRIAWLAEDETTTSFFKLLLRICRALGECYPDEFPAEALEPLYGAGEAGRVKLLSRLLVEKLAGRTLLVIVENLDELFKGLGEEGQQEWRAFLQENPISATLATSQQLFDGVSRRDSPFYGHFQIEHLKPLSLEEAVLLLRRIADVNGDTKLSSFLRTATGRSRVRALHHLSGGNHRIYIVLSDIITAESLDELVGPFEKMLDELTPYYQARLSWLSAQQREMVEYLCGCAQPVPVKDMARALFITHQTATGQLKELRERGYVVGHTYGRESRYELSEPMMRLCVKVKENRRQPMRLIVDFLRIWYSRDQLQQRLLSLTGECTMERTYVEEAIRCTDTMADDPRILAIRADLDRALLAGERDEVVRLREELAEARGHPGDWCMLGYELRTTRRRYEEALAAYDQALALSPADAFTWNNRGVTLSRLGRHEEALVSFDKALAIHPAYAYAWNNRGATLNDLGCYEGALTALDKALAIQPDYAYPHYNRVEAVLSLNRWDEGFAALRDSLRQFPPATEQTAGDTKALVGIVLKSAPDREIWRGRAARLVQIYAEAGALGYLRDGLIRSLALPAVRMLNPDALAAWREVWVEVGNAYDALTIPLRIFGVGIRYLQTGDRRVLLDLLSEERQILAEVFGLDQPTEPDHTG
jgi:tetratricopeptide (TPR) repeat protein